MYNYMSESGIIKQITKTRKINAKNFNPMIVNSTMWQNFKNDYIQIQIDFLGSPAWINIKKSELKPV